MRGGLHGEDRSGVHLAVVGQVIMKAGSRAVAGGLEERGQVRESRGTFCLSFLLPR